MKVYLLGALFLLVVHQAAAQGLFGSRAAGGGEPAEGAEGAGGAGGEGGGTNPGGIFSALLGGSAGGGGEGGEGGGTKPGGIFSALLGGSAGGGGEGGEAAEGGAPGPRNPST
ncbi:hypothetical protein DPMN_065485 [Dreissena polymorpha]|uniref:Uncharacterized protein n=1 Tax=Dreissena polymorpha TaxID=45954 RepID=A0A9D3YW23_DREPO|nr:hypothetical protein DPMN_065485 [Dreissena polymorpha]